MSFAFHAAQDEKEITTAEMKGGTLGSRRPYCRNKRSHHLWTRRCFIPRTWAAVSRAVGTQFFAYIAEVSRFSRRNNMLSSIQSYERSYQRALGPMSKIWWEGGIVLPQHMCYVRVDGIQWKWVPSTPKVSNTPRAWCGKCLMLYRMPISYWLGM